MAISALGVKLSQRRGCESDPLAMNIETRMERVSLIVGATTSHHLKFDWRGCVPCTVTVGRAVHGVYIWYAMNGWICFQHDLHRPKAGINLDLRVKTPQTLQVD